MFGYGMALMDVPLSSVPDVVSISPKATVVASLVIPAWKDSLCLE